MILPTVFGTTGLALLMASVSEQCAHPVTASIVGGVLLGLSPGMRDDRVLPTPFRHLAR